MTQMTNQRPTGLCGDRVINGTEWWNGSHIDIKGILYYTIWYSGLQLHDVVIRAILWLGLRKMDKG